jgi:DNA-binding GntR family transcriptional regulator
VARRLALVADRHVKRIVRIRTAAGEPLVMETAYFPVALVEAALLGTRSGAPAFQVERTTWSDDGPIEWQQAIVRGDRFLYSVELANLPGLRA